MVMLDTVFTGEKHLLYSVPQFFKLIVGIFCGMISPLKLVFVQLFQVWKQDV